MLILMKLFDSIARVFYFLGDACTRVKTYLWNSKTGRAAQLKQVQQTLSLGKVGLKKEWRDEIASMKENSGNLGWREKAPPQQEAQPGEAP